MSEFEIDHGILTREEYLERDYWTLQFTFENLMKEDLKLASKFIKWAMLEWSRQAIEEINSRAVKGE